MIARARRRSVQADVPPPAADGADHRLPDAAAGDPDRRCGPRRSTCPAFPTLHGFLDFMLAGAMIQSTLLAGNSGGIALAVDIEMGFTDRLLAAPISRFAIVLGRLAGTAALGALSAHLVHRDRADLRRPHRGGRPGRAADDRLRGRSRRSRSAGSGRRSRCGPGRRRVVQGLFPLVFVILFLSSAFFPANLMLEPAATVAEYNPLSFIVEGVRDPVISSLSLEVFGKALGVGRAGRGARHRPERAGAAQAACEDGRLTQLGWRADLRTVCGAGAARRQRDAAGPGRCDPRRAGADDLLPRADRRSSAASRCCRASRPSSYQSFMIPVSLLQGAGFTGAATGVNLARDIEQGWFDRLLASPAPRPVLLAGLVLSAGLRALIPATVLLTVGLRDRRPLARASAGSLIALFLVMGMGSSRPAGARSLALRVQVAVGGAADAGRDVRRSILTTTAYAPLALLQGWLQDGRQLNPVTQILEAARQGFVGGVTWGDTWPGLLALAGLLARAGRLRPARHAPDHRLSERPPARARFCRDVLGAKLGRGRAARRPLRLHAAEPGALPWQWYWDSCFAAIVWRRFDPDALARELETLLGAPREDGFIGHTIFWERPVTLSRRCLLQRRLALGRHDRDDPAAAAGLGVADRGRRPGRGAADRRPPRVARAPTATSRATGCSGSSSPTSRGSTPRRSSTRSGAGGPTPDSGFPLLVAPQPPPRLGRAARSATPAGRCCAR